MKDVLTSANYWDENAVKISLPVKYDHESSISSKELDNIFVKVLPVGRQYRFIELGCAPGGWMYYFATRFKFNVFGIDFAPSGVSATRKNLKLLSIEAVVLQGDLLDYSHKNKYDIVFSAGLIEHFRADKLESIISKHLEIVNHGGYVIISVPNLRGFNYYYQRLLNKDNISIHNLEIMNLEFFRQLGLSKNLEIEFIGYAGRINFGLYAGPKMFGYIHQFLQISLGILYKIGIKIPDSKYYSPYILAIYKKEA